MTVVVIVNGLFLKPVVTPNPGKIKNVNLHKFRSRFLYHSADELERHFMELVIELDTGILMPISVVTQSASSN